MGKSGILVSSKSAPIYKESDDKNAVEAIIGELLPAFDLTTLPSITFPGQFVSKHANVADYAIASVTSKHSRRTYESRLRAVAQLLGFEDLRNVPWENLRYEHVAQIRDYRHNDANKSFASVNANAISASRCSKSGIQS